jgi:hypothetical protein
MAEPQSPHEGSQVDIQATDRLFAVMLDELSEEHLALPLPASLTELSKMRSEAPIKDFRQMFEPWLQALASGDSGAEKKLRISIRHATRHFKSYTLLHRIGNIATWVSLPVGFADPTGGFIGAGLGLISVGMSRLASRWKASSQWVALCSKSDNSPTEKR